MDILSERLKDHDDQNTEKCMEYFLCMDPNKRLREYVNVTVKSFYDDNRKMVMRI